MLGVSKNPCTMVQRPVLGGRCQEAEEERGSEQPQGHCSPRNYSAWIDHFHTHTQTHTQRGGSMPFWVDYHFSSSHLPVVFNISSQRTKKSWSQTRQSPMETFLKKLVTALSFSHFSPICFPPEWTTIQCPFSESKRTFVHWKQTASIHWCVHPFHTNTLSCPVGWEGLPPLWERNNSASGLDRIFAPLGSTSPGPT